jgi:NADH:ubiquinone oxidoreductase 27 kD subunit
VAEDATVEDVAEEEVLPVRPLPEHPVLRRFVEADESLEWSSSSGQDVVRVPAERLAEVGEAARDAGFELGADLTAVDRLGIREPRFEVVVNLLSVQHNVRLRLLVTVPDEEDPVVPTLSEVWPGLEFFEREVYDMFGIRFEGHSDLTRILMPDDWVGHPLRKDYATGEVPVQFKASPKAV